ncbi:hypothetical protein HDU67_009296 [Dinochytrium kinnereticum]|nr:hypothetical protein HDU67_009296 [Dinochytrium kinnereticum]
MATEASTDQPQTEWEKYWNLVSTNPDDFTSWEALIRVAETANGGITKQSSEEDTSNLRTVYDHFLAKFPLCFGYWKKYADWELSLEGDDKAESIYERGVASIHNSVDLWTHFASFKVGHGDEESVRAVFERGASAVGYDFLSHTFWDKFIEFEESKQEEGRVMGLLERIIRIPLHQYARYFEKYSQLSVTRPVTELMTQDELDKLEEEVRATGVAKSDEETQAELRQKIHAVKSEIYMQNQEAVHKRWVFESEIKRPYFHIKPIDEAQVANWKRYLDFEEAEGDVARCYILYERCLVACALYEEFWVRYARFLVSRGDFDGARNVFIRSTTIFVAPGRTSIRLQYAGFEEEHGKAEDAREIYGKILQAVPGHVETLYKLAYFEKRQSGFEKGLEVLSNGIDSASDNKAKAFLVVTKAKYVYNIKGDIEEARRIYTEHLSSLSDQKYLLLSYFVFETTLPGSETISHAKNAWESVKASSAFAADEKRELGLRLLDLLHDRSDTLGPSIQFELDLLKDYPTESSPPASASSAPPTASADSNKRRAAGAPDDGSPFRAAKIAKVEPPIAMGGHPPQPPPQMMGMGMQGAYGAYPQAAQAAAAMWGQMGGYYGQQQGWDYSQQQQGGAY